MPASANGPAGLTSTMTTPGASTEAQLSGYIGRQWFRGDSKSRRTNEPSLAESICLELLLLLHVSQNSECNLNPRRRAPIRFRTAFG